MASAHGARRVLVAVAQMTSRNVMADNQAVVNELAAAAAARGATMLFLPENVNYFKGDAPAAGGVLEPLTGPAVEAYRAIARRHRMWLSLGGVQEAATGAHAGKGHNTQVIIDADGGLAAAYRKAHLFDADAPAAGLRLRESDSTAAGCALTVVDTPVGRLGLSVCYDVRFPGLYGALAAAGAQVLSIPAAFTVPTGAAHWELLLRARAVETQCYVVAAAQVGAHSSARTSYGHAMVVDPWGTVVAQAGGPEAAGSSPTLLVAEIDLGFLADVRSRMPVGAHARPDLYASPVAVGSESLVAPGVAASGRAATGR